MYFILYHQYHQTKCPQQHQPCEVGYSIRRDLRRYRENMAVTSNHLVQPTWHTAPRG